MKAPKPITLTDLANKIQVHLERMEADPVLNRLVSIKTTVTGPFMVDRELVDDPMGGAALFYRPQAYRCGARIKNRSFQAGRKITREAAERYLAWLDAGNSDTYGRFNGAHMKRMMES